MMVHDADLAQGLTLRFRHLAGELRRASSHPHAAREFERLRFRGSHALRDAFDAKLLPTPILDELLGLSTSMNLFWEYQPIHSFVGYCEPCEYLAPIEYDDESGCCWSGHRAVFLEPGAVSLVWPGVFESIFCGDFRNDPQTDVKEIARTAWIDERFTIMGYYATACELLADWIEKHANNDREHDGKPDQHDGDSTVSATLNAVVESGLAGVLQSAAGTRSVDRVTAIIRKRVANDARLYSRKADHWAAELKVTKKTITDSDGWREIMQWRAANRANRVSKKTGE